MAVTSVLKRVKGSRTTEDAAEALAGDFRTSHSVLGPLDVREAARYFNAAVTEKEMQVDASLKRIGSRYEIAVNKKTSPLRRRFSIAHELGHIAMFNATGMSAAFSHRAAGDYSAPAVDPAVEAACDAFASELLMPRSEWANITMQFGSTVPVLRRLTRLYKVSLEAGSRRMVDAGAWRIAIVLWRLSRTSPEGTMAEAIRFFRKNFMTDEAWPGPVVLNKLVGENLKPSPTTCHAEQLELAFGEYARQIFAESGWLHSREPVIVSVITGEPHPRNLHGQFPGEDGLTKLTDAQLLGADRRPGALQNYTFPFA
jgi:IrrE N-terminal-like domain